MKKNISILIMAIMPLFSVLAQQPDIAKVNKILGLYVFTDSEPVCEYKILGEVKNYISWTGQHSEIVNRLARAGKNKYPNANGIIINFVTGGADIGTIIYISEDCGKFSEKPQKKKTKLIEIEVEDEEESKVTK